jgi:hypothetical protein
VRGWRLFRDVIEWLPILVVPLLIYGLTEGFTSSLSMELWLVLGFVVLINLGWIGLTRWNRHMLEFRQKYPGFRVKK